MTFRSMDKRLSAKAILDKYREVENGLRSDSFFPPL